MLQDDRELTYKQFNAWANRIADYLASIGLKKGDTVAVDVENRPELLAAVLGCAKLGVCAALLNTSQKGKVLVHSFNLVEPKAAIIGEELVDTIHDIRDDMSVDGVVRHCRNESICALEGASCSTITEDICEASRWDPPTWKDECQEGENSCDPMSTYCYRLNGLDFTDPMYQYACGCREGFEPDHSNPLRCLALTPAPNFLAELFICACHGNAALQLRTGLGWGCGGWNLCSWA